MIVRCFGNRVAQEVRVICCGLSLLAVSLAVIAPASASIVWDGEANSHWWFDPTNWDAAGNSNTVLPPSNNAAGTTATDTQINLGIGAWNQGEGVVFDPTNDPNFADVGDINFPGGFGPQIINGLFMSRGTTESTLLTIKDSLTFRNPVHVGSASGVRGSATNATIVQESGTVDVPRHNLVIATINTSSTGRGNGTYEYRGGTLRIAQQDGNGLILSAGSNENSVVDGDKAGPGGIGKFIVHNPDTLGHIRVFNLTTVDFAGFDEGIPSNPNDSEFNTAYDADGESTGVGIFEFHYANGGTRPIQVNNNMTLNNGLDKNTKGIRSSRLNFVLDEAPCDTVGCIPSSIGLFDVGFAGSGLLLGSGDLDGDMNFTNDRVFSSIDGMTHYREGEVVSAVFGTTRFEWTISYTGDINWSNATNSEISSITGAGTGNDIVLIGLGSSEGLPGDFDSDGDVDGRDFLAWQRGESPVAFSAEDLADWQENYGATPLANVAAVPEPTGILMLWLATLSLCTWRR